MAKLTLMQGLPASGKSTRAEQIAKEAGNTVRISRDFLREMLHFGKWTGKNEGKTLQVARIAARHFLLSNTNVIIDDTNLNPDIVESWKQLAKEEKAKFEVARLDTGWQLCALWDSRREKPWGGHVVKEMALRYGLVEHPANGWVLCDIDGTIADIEHRLHFVQSPVEAITYDGKPLPSNMSVFFDFKKDWKGFFGAMQDDAVRGDVRKILIELYNRGHNVIFLSARPDDYRKVTESWLEANGVGFAFTVLMRRGGDTRPDVEVKKDILDRFFPDRSVIAKVIDDRPSVIRMWRENGLEVLDVGNGVEF